MILVFQAGRIVASGTHQELLENSDIYKKLAGKMTYNDYDIS
jgi:ABC-type multidrug transport system fused ATPase/permease subunit